MCDFDYSWLNNDECYGLQIGRRILKEVLKKIIYGSKLQFKRKSKYTSEIECCVSRDLKVGRGIFLFPA